MNKTQKTIRLIVEIGLFAAIGFETTTPVYAMVLKEIIAQDVHNLKLLKLNYKTSLQLI